VREAGQNWNFSLMKGMRKTVFKCQTVLSFKKNG